MNKKKIIYLFLSILVIISLCMYVLRTKDSSIETSGTIISEYENLSNKKIEWGIKREKDHKQPDVGTKNREILDKYDGIYLGNSNDKYVYLTFDEGYEAGYTEKILEVLKQNDIKAGFFITAHYLNTHPELVERMINDGHIVGNHTVNHKSMPSIGLEEIKKEVMDLHTTIYDKYGYEMKYIRPPKGEYSERTVAYTKSLGYITTMWSFAYMDWDENKQGREDYAKKMILDNLHNGEVILLHGNSKDNANILDYIIKEIKSQGYEFKSLDEYKK